MGRTSLARNSAPRRVSREQGRRDPYRAESDIGTVQCPSCKSVQFRGKWISAEQAQTRVGSRADLDAHTCPACRQNQEHYAMGVIELHGERWRRQSTEVFSTISNTEALERSRNDQERVLWSRTYQGTTKIYVSLPELARRIGRELHRAFKGKIEYHRSTEEPYLRVVWHSDT